MKKLWTLIGRIAYVLAWPGLYFYLKNSQRSRVIVRSGNKILVLKDWLGEGKWKLPGGGIHNRETAAVSAQRELFEETGINVDINKLKFQGVYEAVGHGTQISFHIFSCQLPSTVAIKHQKFEIIDSAWLSLTELRVENISSHTKEILKNYCQL